MILRNRLLRTFIPLLIVPLIGIILIQLALTRNYLTAGQRNLLEFEIQVLKDNFYREYQERVTLQIVDVPFFRARLLDGLYDRLYTGDDPSRGFITFDSQGDLARPSTLGDRTQVSPEILSTAKELADSGGIIALPGGIGGQFNQSYIAGAFYHESSDWYFLVYSSLSSVLLPLAQSALITAIAGTLALVLASLAVIAASRRLSQPIVNLTDMVARFGEGETSVRSDIRQEGEVGILAREFNTMAGRLESFKQDLELKISARTEELRNRMEELKLAQDQLIEAEKMAALGGLVAGFAHEINTPIGVSVTAVSYINESISKALEMVSAPEVSRGQLVTSLEQIQSATELGNQNLARASEMIQRFKQVAADQYFEEKLTINLREFLMEIRDTLLTILKPARAELIIDVPNTISLTTFRGVLWQLLSNLTRNCLHHAFHEIPMEEGKEPNKVWILYGAGKHSHHLYICDNGEGISGDNVSRIFDPFFTTRRGSGNTGLGLHIVYNLVHQKLGGRFAYITPEARDTVTLADLPRTGACFLISLPDQND